MTKEELKKLAEIAGVRITIFSNVLYYHLDGKPIVISTEFIWQPHLRIEQAMMVAEAFTAFYVGKDIGQYFCGLAVPDSRGIKYLPKMHSTNIPLAICRAALAAAKEG